MHESSIKATIKEDEELDELLSSKVSLVENTSASKHKQVKSNGFNNKDPPSQPKPANDASAIFKSANWLSESELIFSLTNQVGGLVRALRIFEELGIGIKHVESRRSKRRDSEFEIFVDIDCSDQDKMKKLVHHLR